MALTPALRAWCRMIHEYMDDHPDDPDVIRTREAEEKLRLAVAGIDRASLNVAPYHRERP